MANTMEKCRICGDYRFVAPKTHYRLEKGYNNRVCRSCGLLLVFYDEGFVRWIRYLSKARVIVPYSIFEKMTIDQGKSKISLRCALQKQGVIIDKKRSPSIRHAASIGSRKVMMREKIDKCSACGAKEKLQMHHVWPIEFGGDPNGEMVCLCHECHIIRHKKLRAKILEEYGSLIAFRHTIFTKHKEELAHLFADSD